MKRTYDAAVSRAEPTPDERTGGSQLRQLHKILITALLLATLAGTIGFWCWAVWWGTLKLMSLMF